MISGRFLCTLTKRFRKQVFPRRVLFFFVSRSCCAAGKGCKGAPHHLQHQPGPAPGRERGCPHGPCDKGPGLTGRAGIHSKGDRNRRAGPRGQARNYQLRFPAFSFILSLKPADPAEHKHNGPAEHRRNRPAEHRRIDSAEHRPVDLTKIRAAGRRSSDTYGRERNRLWNQER